jgi:glycosyltransferase involved in cell wall biosynthesis
MKPKLMLLIPEMCTGGAQRSLAKLSIELSHHASIFFVVFNLSQPFAYPVAGDIFSLEVYPKRHWSSKIFSFWQRVVRLRKLKRRLRINVCISFLEGADYINILSKSREKVVLSIRGSKLHDEVMQAHLFKFRSKILIPWLYRRADSIVTINRGIMWEMIESFKIPDHLVQTIYNFYDFSEIKTQATMPKEEFLDKFYESPVLVTTGRLAPEKRLSYLLKVFAELRSFKTNVKFIFIGDGPELQQLLKLCQETSLLTNYDSLNGKIPDVIFMGNQENVFKYLNGSSVFLLNSSSEGLPNGMIEAMICGIPVIASDCPYGPKEILAPELNIITVDKPHITSNGILMPLDNSKENILIWAQTINALLDDERLRDRLSDCGRERSRIYHKETIMAQWIAMLLPS